MQVRGHPRVVWAPEHAVDHDARRRLWEVSEELTGVEYDFGVSAPANHDAPETGIIPRGS